MIRTLFQRFSIIHFFFGAELVLTMLLNVILGNVYRYSMQDYRRLDDFGHEGIYFSTLQDNMNGSFQKVRKEIEALPSFEGWSNTTTCSSINADEATTTDASGTGETATSDAEETALEDIIISMDKLSSRLFPLETERGKWFAEEAPDSKGRIPCVVVDNALRNCEVGDDIQSEGKNFHVTGIVSPDNNYFDIMSQYGNSDTETLSNLVTAELPRDYRTIICCGILPEEYPDQTSVIAYFRPDTPQKELKAAEKILDAQGVTETFQEMKAVTYRQCSQQVMQYFPFALIFGVISILSILAITMIDSGYILHCYGIYAICGCRWKTILGKYCRTILFLALIAMAAVYLLIWGITVSEPLYLFLQTKSRMDSLHDIREGGIHFTDIIGNGVLCLAYAGIAGIILHAIKGRNAILDCMKKS